MDKPVKLKEIVDAFEYPEDWEVYLNKKTGEIICFSEGDRMFLDRIAEEEDVEDLPNWQREALPNLQKNQEAVEAGDCVALPSHFDIHEWDIMRRFALSFGDSRKSDQLLDAIHGRGAFRYFRDTVHRLGIADKWYKFRDHALEQIAIEWLEANGIPFERD